MKRTTVVLSVMLVFLFALASTAAGASVSIWGLKVKQYNQDHYSWELTKNCDIAGPVSIPAGESVSAKYVVTATRGEPQTIRTIEIRAKVSGTDKAKVTYNNVSHEVDVVNGEIMIELPYVDNVNWVTVTATSGGASASTSTVSYATGIKESINAVATLQDIFDPAPAGLAFDFSSGFMDEWELDDPAESSYIFEYTVDVKNLSSYGETYILENVASLILEEGEPLVKSASFVLTTPEKPESVIETEDKPEKQEEAKTEPKPEPGKKSLPRTNGACGALGLMGVLVTAAGILIRRLR